MSTKTGRRPALTIALTVGTAVFEVVITSSFFLKFNDINAICKASVPLLTPIPYLHPTYFENLSSKDLTSLPSIKFPDEKTLFTILPI